MSELINTSPKEKNQNSLQNRIKTLFDNDHVFWTALILWFIPVFLVLPLLSSIIPNVEVIVVLIIIFPILYLLIPIVVFTFYIQNSNKNQTLWYVFQQQNKK